MSQPEAGESCFHCGEKIPSGIDLSVTIDNIEQPMCCHGCKAVAQAIVDNHLEDFYHHRTDKAQTPEELIPEALRDLQVFDNDSVQQSFVHQKSGDLREASLILEGIVCAACVWLNERHVNSLKGVQSFHVNYSTHRAQVTWDNSQIHLSDILQAITQIGYHAHPFDPGRLEAIHKRERQLSIRRIGVAGVGAMQVMMMAVALYLGDYQGMSHDIRDLLRWASMIVAFPVVAYSGQSFFLSAWRDLKRLRVGMDVPVSIAIGTAYVASVWATVRGTGEVYYDSVTMFTFFLLLGRFLEMTARHKAGQVADELVKLIPATAHVRKGESWEPVAVAELSVGDEVVIKPGEPVPADGTVIEGRSNVDESLLTGESLPRDKSQGDSLIGGTINIESPLVMRVTELGQDTVLAGISRLLERAQEDKPQVAQLANRVAGWFVAALLIVAALVFFYWHQVRPEDAFWITLSVLVITCPCALSLATPVALTAATGALTELGVLTTRGHALETLSKTTDLVFDKTGTLTEGRLRLEQVENLSGQDRDFIFGLAAGLEAQSEHPIAIAFREKAKPFPVDLLTSETGRGVTGRYDSLEYRLGNARYVREWHPEFEEPELPGTLVYLADRKQVLAIFVLNDRLREGAAEVLSAIAGQNIRLHLLSGDARTIVQRVATQLGIEHWQAELLPADKLEYVKRMQAEGRIVAMVGDGVNDAPVLAGAQVSIAMGAGAQLAQASADMVLLSDRLDVLPQSIEKARQTLRIIRQNLGWAVGYNLVALPLAAAGFIAPWMAAIGMSGSSLLVVLNALRLRTPRVKLREG
ncbi:MAG: heavy metal translocating P-type ATPase [Thiotrichales bacterium]